MYHFSDASAYLKARSSRLMIILRSIAHDLTPFPHHTSFEYLIVLIGQHIIIMKPSTYNSLLLTIILVIVSPSFIHGQLELIREGHIFRNNHHSLGRSGSSPNPPSPVSSSQTSETAKTTASPSSTSSTSSSTSLTSTLYSVINTGANRYLHISDDQCKNRAACEMGGLVYKKISFINNWLLRLAIRNITDMSSPYAQAWLEGMMGHSCSRIFDKCKRSPLQTLASLGLIPFM